MTAENTSSEPGSEFWHGTAAAPAGRCQYGRGAGRSQRTMRQGHCGIELAGVP